jgi:hypothetical protein
MSASGITYEIPCFAPCHPNHEATRRLETYQKRKQAAVQNHHSHELYTSGQQEDRQV